MNSSNLSFKNVDHYIEASAEEVQDILRSIRQTIQLHAPAATEGIAYGMPAYKLNDKPLVYFAAFKNHIGFYATPAGHEAFAKELSKYKQGKGSVQFPIDQPMPLKLIANMVKFKVTENMATAKKAAKK